MTTPTTAPPGIAVDHAKAMADDLIRELATHIGTEDRAAGMDAVFLRWLDELDVGIYRVALAALRRVFVDLLEPTDPGDWPPHGIAFVVDTDEGS